MIRFKDLKFETKLSALGLLFIAGFVAFGFLTYRTLDEIKMHQDPLTQREFIVDRAFSLLALGATVVAVASIFSWIFARSFVRPLKATAQVLQSVATGDLRGRIEVDSKDEVGRMGEALNKSLVRISDAIQVIGLNSQALKDASGEVATVSEEMASNAEETSAQADVVASAAEKVNKNVHTAAVGAEEMTASIKEIAKNASEAACVATTAVKAAEATSISIAKLGESSREIGDVTRLITSIAQQTNLLALNATIEAARAGDAGRGFAVVANEVKELARGTAQATEDISQKITAIQESTKNAIAAIEQICSIINQINDISNTIASAVEQQSATTNEIARNVAEAAIGSCEIAKNISSVALVAKGTAAGAGNTQTAAQELALMAATLQELVSQFKCSEHSSPASIPIPREEAHARLSSSRIDTSQISRELFAPEAKTRNVEQFANGSKKLA